MGTSSQDLWIKEHAEYFMRLALDEARKGLGRTSPNPAVGAVLVKNGKVIAKGYHQKAGGPHAEVVAIKNAGEQVQGADLYATLEPCNHYGRTPPCTEAIVQAGISRVFVGCQDTNPLVAGQGISKLQKLGIPVFTGILEEECSLLNRAFFTFVNQQRPFVTIKVAATADGKIATTTGDSRWITGLPAREKVHVLRDQVDAILVGAGTVRADDPALTARPNCQLAQRQPLRVILSANLNISSQARIFRETAGKALVLTTARLSEQAEKNKAQLESQGIEVVSVNTVGAKTDLHAVLNYLALRNVVHLLVEGGAGIFGAFLENQLVDEAMLFIAPKVLGSGLSWARLTERVQMGQAIHLTFSTTEMVGEDLLIVGRAGVRQPR